MTTLVRAAHVLTMGPAGDVRDGAVAFDGDRIVAIGPWPELAARYPDADRRGDGHGVLIPGLVNCHNHLSEALICGMASDLTLWEWGQRLIVPVGRVLDRDMAYLGTRVKAAEMLLSGVTCVNDMFCYENHAARATLGVVDALEELGVRAVESLGAADVELGAQGPPNEAMHELIFAEHEALADRCAASPLVSFRYGISTILDQSPELFERGIKRAAAEGWAVHTHLAEVREELTASRLAHGVNTLEHAHRHGLLDLELLAAHCVWVNESDISLLAARDVKVAHNPVANMILASGVCPVPRLRREGVTVGIGTDGAASNDSNNMLEAMKMAALIQKLHHLDATRMRATDALRMATIEGARALTLDREIGSIEVGKKADLVRFSGLGPGLANVHDPYERIVYCASPRDVADVWVDGVQRVAAGELVGADVAELVLDSKPAAAELVSRAGLGELSVLARAQEER
ncbi:MAG: amidohydrolase family protein [Acidimicrobiia bacterium]